MGRFPISMDHAWEIIDLQSFACIAKLSSHWEVIGLAKIASHPISSTRTLLPILDAAASAVGPHNGLWDQAQIMAPLWDDRNNWSGSLSRGVWLGGSTSERSKMTPQPDLLLHLKLNLKLSRRVRFLVITILQLLRVEGLRLL